jgi:hypothetical protein
LCLAAAVAAAQDSLGRLFLTPEQRASLDAARDKAMQPAPRPAQAQAPAPAASALPPKVITLNGIVRRSDGETTVWVNDRPLHDDFRQADIARGSVSRAAVAVRLPTSGRHVQIKVGQTVDAATGRVEEGYRRPPVTAAGATEKVAEAAAAPEAMPAAEAQRDARARQRRRDKEEMDDGDAPSP